MNQKESLDLIVDYVASHPQCVLATADEKSRPWAAAIFSIACTHRGALQLYFFSRSTETKSRHVESNPAVALAFVDVPSVTTLQVAGTASIVTDIKTKRAMFDRLVSTAHEKLVQWAPIFQRDDGTVQIYCIDVTFAKLSDFSGNSPTVVTFES